MIMYRLGTEVHQFSHIKKVLQIILFTTLRNILLNRTTKRWLVFMPCARIPLMSCNIMSHRLHCLSAHKLHLIASCESGHRIYIPMLLLPSMTKRGSTCFPWIRERERDAEYRREINYNCVLFYNSGYLGLY